MTAARITYACAECGAMMCKLWREGNVLGPVHLRCVNCAAAYVGIDPGTVDDEGKVLGEFGRSDQLYRRGKIGLLPAVPDDTWTTYWGYTSVPPDGVAWWRYLPTHPSPPKRIT